MLLPYLVSAHDLDNMLSDDWTLPPPKDPAFKAQCKARACVRTSMIGSLLESITNQVDIASDDSPHAILTNLDSIFSSPSTTDHYDRRQEAESTFFTTDIKVEEFYERHNAIRARMKTLKFS